MTIHKGGKKSGRPGSGKDRTLRLSRSRLFKHSPVSTWEEDFSSVKKRLEDLKNRGINDFRKYFRSHPEEVISLAKKVRILDVNNATLRLFQANSKAELRRGLHKVFNKESYNAFREELIALAEGKAEFQAEAVTKTLRGKERHVFLKLAVSPGCLDSLSHVFLSIVDISELKDSEKELRESEEKYRTIVEVIPLPLLIADAESGIVLETNRSAERLLGISMDQVVGMHLMQLLTQEGAGYCREITNAHSDDVASFSEAVVTCRRSGKRIPVLMRSTATSILKRRCLLISFQAKDTDAEMAAERRGLKIPGFRPAAHRMEAEKLSRRELEVIRLISSGLTSRQIAAKLFISIKTVETHRARIMEKLGFHKAADIVRFAILAGLLEDSSAEN